MFEYTCKIYKTVVDLVRIEAFGCELFPLRLVLRVLLRSFRRPALIAASNMKCCGLGVGLQLENGFYPEGEKSSRVFRDRKGSYKHYLALQRALSRGKATCSMWTLPRAFI